MSETKSGYQIGNGHPDPEIAFGIELDILEGEAFDVRHGMRSQWPFWARLSNALRVGRENDWFGIVDAEALLLRLHDEVMNTDLMAARWHFYRGAANVRPARAFLTEQSQ